MDSNSNRLTAIKPEDQSTNTSSSQLDVKVDQGTPPRSGTTSSTSCAVITALLSANHHPSQTVHLK
ncbi:MAG: hypothetical protein Q9183_006081 [Haloplaca sp. 2 TL-2023]